MVTNINNTTTNISSDEKIDLHNRISTNIKKLLTAMGWEQKLLATKVNRTEAAISGYLSEKTLPKLDFLIDLTKLPDFKERGIYFTLDDLVSANFTPGKALGASSNLYNPDLEEMIANSFNGNYICYLFDQSKITEQEINIPREFRYGVITICTEKDNITGNLINNVYAKFYKSHEKSKALKYKQNLDEIFSYDDIKKERRSNRIHTTIDSEDGIYYGNLSFNGEQAFIYLSSREYNDTALIILNNPRKKNDSEFIGGCGSLNSVSHGSVHTPVGQKIIISRYELMCDDEQISEYLRMPHISIFPTSETKSLTELCQKLYSGNNAGLYSLDENDKFSIINNRMKLLIQNYIEKNTCCVINITPEEDRKIYRIIKNSQ